MSEARARIVVIDDKASMRGLMETVLSLEHDVEGFANPVEALARMAREPADVVVSDVRMPELTGLEVLERMRAGGLDSAVILVTAYGTVGEAVEAVKRGAFDYLQKPFEPDELSLRVRRALHHQRREARARSLEREGRAAAMAGLVGVSPALARVRDLIARVAPSDATVLVTGPSGTGKEVVARSIHRESPRRDGPFVVVHCAALPKDLLETELFGHVKGAFSGAAETRRGMVEEARGGTLFLDDVNYLDRDLQAKVNRLVQEREVKPVGAASWRKVDTRIIAAANVDLEDAVRRGAFREDLYYRLNVLEIALAPLDARPEDIVPLALHFLAKHGARLGRPTARLTDAALAALPALRWPGNVRQLENACERALILADSPEIGPEAFAPASASTAASTAASAASGERAALEPRDIDRPYADVLQDATARAARAYLEALLDRFDGNVTRAAEHAGMARQHLHRLLNQHAIDRRPPRDP